MANEMKDNSSTPYLNAMLLREIIILKREISLLKKDLKNIKDGLNVK